MPFSRFLHQILFRRQRGGRPERSPTPRDSAVGDARRSRWGLALVALLVVAGLALERLGVLDWHAGLALAQGHADRWWLAPVLALVTAGLYAAGLPGSLMVWVVGILFPPQVAVPLLVAGGVAGALGAAELARVAVATGSRAEGDGRLLRLLARRSNFATLLAVRVTPGFPHSAINFAAGALKVPRARFLASTALGLAVKSALYATAIHRAARLATLDDAISWSTVAPLVGLALLLLLAPPLLRRFRGPADPAAVPVEPA